MGGAGRGAPFGVGGDPNDNRRGDVVFGCGDTLITLQPA